MLNMPNTHIYVNMLDYLDSDYCTIDDDFEERWELLKSWLLDICDKENQVRRDDIGWRQMTLYWRRSTGDAKRRLQYEEQDSTAFFRGNNTSRYVVSDHFVCNFLDKAFYTCPFWSQNLNILYSLFLQNSPQLALYWIHGSWNQRIRKFCRDFLEWSYYFPIFPMERHWTDS